MAGKMNSWTGLAQGSIRGYSADLVDLIGRMLHPEHRRRPSAAEIVEECTDEKQDEANFNSFGDM